MNKKTELLTEDHRISLRMNIYSQEGDKVKVVQKSYGGWFYNIEALVMGVVYTVEKTEVHTWHTKVYLKEFPGLYFNSVCFEDYKNDK